MIGVIIIAVLFTALAIGVAWAASRGGLGGVSRAVQTQSRQGSRVVNSILIVVYVVFAVAVPLVFILGNRDTSTAQVGGIQLTSSEQFGRTLFAEHCGMCHTLGATSSVGKVGPNLDVLKPTESQVLTVIAHGCLQKPLYANSGATCAGYGTMPADLVQGEDAQDVAAFVSAVAGHP
jgi:hypothetical protein